MQRLKRSVRSHLLLNKTSVTQITLRLLDLGESLFFELGYAILNSLLAIFVKMITVFHGGSSSDHD